MNVNPAIVWPAFGVLAVILLLMNQSVRKWLGRLVNSPQAENNRFVEDQIDRLEEAIRNHIESQVAEVEAEPNGVLEPDAYDAYHARLDSFRELHSHVKAHGDEEAQKALETLLPLITKDQPETNEG